MGKFLIMALTVFCNFSVAKAESMVEQVRFIRTFFDPTIRPNGHRGFEIERSIANLERYSTNTSVDVDTRARQLYKERLDRIEQRQSNPNGYNQKGEARMARRYRARAYQRMAHIADLDRKLNSLIQKEAKYLENLKGSKAYQGSTSVSDVTRRSQIQETEQNLKKQIRELNKFNRRTRRIKGVSLIELDPRRLTVVKTVNDLKTKRSPAAGNVLGGYFNGLGGLSAENPTPDGFSIPSGR